MEIIDINNGRVTKKGWNHRNLKCRMPNLPMVGTELGQRLGK